MPFGSLTTELKVDLAPLDKALDTAIRKLETFNRDANKLAQVSLRQARGGGIGGRGGAADPFSAAGPGGVFGAGSLKKLNDDILKIGKQAGRDRNREEERLGRESNAIRLTQKNFRLKQIKEEFDAKKKAAKQEEEVAKRADAEIMRSAKARFKFIGDQARAQEQASRRAESSRAGVVLSDIRNKFRDIGVRPMSVSAGDPQAISKLAKQFDEANSASSRLSRTLVKIGREDIKNLVEGARHFVRALTFAGGIAAVGVLGAMVKKGFELNTEWERYSLALSASLALTQDVVNTQGQLVKGPKSIAFIGQQSKQLFKDIRDEANKTILDTNELVQIFAENVGNAARAGIDVKEFLPIASNIGQLTKALGLPGGSAQASQEVRSLLEGTNLRNSTVAKLLGLTTELIEKAKEEGRLAELINERFKDALPIIKQFEHSAQALFSTLISKGQDFLRQAFGRVFESARKALEKLKNSLTDEKVTEFADKFADSIDLALNRIEKFVKGKDFQTFASVWKFIADNAKTLLSVAAGFAALRGAGILGAGIAGLGGGGLAGTALGGGLAAIGGAVAPITAAGLAGLGIGTGINSLIGRFNGTTEAEQQASASQAALDDQLRRRRLNSKTSLGALTPEQVDRLSAARSRTRSAESALREARTRAIETPSSTGFSERLTEFTLSSGIKTTLSKAQERVRRASNDERDVQKAITKEQIQAQLEQGKVKGAELKLKAKDDLEAKNERIQTRKDELAQLAELEARARGDKAGIIRAEAQQDISDFRKQFTNKDIRNKAILERERERDFALAKLRGEEARKQQKSEIETEKKAATASGNIRKQILADAKLEKIRAVEEGLDVGTPEFKKRAAETDIDAQRKIAEARKKINEDLRNDTRRVTEIIADSADKQTKIQKDLLDLQRRTEKERRNLIKQRIESEKELTEAIRQQAERREDIQFRRRDARSREADAEQRERLERIISPRLATSGREAGRGGLSQEDVGVQLEEAAQEIAQAVIGSRARTPSELATEIGEAVQSRGLRFGAGQGTALSLARQLFGERTTANRRRLDDTQTGREREALGLQREGAAIGLGPGLSFREQTEFTGLQTRFGQNLLNPNEAIRLNELRRKQEASSGGTELAEGGREIDRRRTALEEVNLRQQELADSYKLAAKELQDNLINAFRDAAAALRKSQVELQGLVNKAQASDLSIPAGLVVAAQGALQRAGQVQPQLQAGAARGAAEQAAGGFPAAAGGKFDLTVGFDAQTMSALSQPLVKSIIELIAPSLGDFIVKESRKSGGGR